MVLCVHVSPPFSSCQWQAFCFMQGYEANNNFLSPHLCSFALIRKEFFFHTRPSMNLYPLGQLRMYWFPPPSFF